ncbi:ABC transporter substrate-binding protein [Azohydromonas lata]|uniref:ABC transporter substrate binding protein n=1 Tax=Azohydromonas lata TaxID=45677 RepID=A0ABU5IKC3_9BURK|nr:ABC transporter substrate binding protein [Azohydromonas lata]MDZ5459353.1 ABC transporter substrate binding protein [Azohydromonas lata]
MSRSRLLQAGKTPSPTARALACGWAMALGCGLVLAQGATRTVLLVMPPQPGKLEVMAQSAARALASAAQVRLMPADAQPGAGLEAAVRGGGVDLLVGVGAAGEQAARAQAGSVRLMSCGAPTTTLPGVMLEHDPAVQFAQLRRMLPTAHRVGLVLHAAEGSPRLDAALQAARRAGLELQPLPVESAADVQPTVERAASALDALMVLADAQVLSPQAARALLTVSMRQRVPLVGPAGSWARAGALYALEWDYEDLGLQCADVALRLLAPRGLGAAPLAPRRAALVINRRAAQVLKVPLAEDVLRSAESIHD